MHLIEFIMRFVDIFNFFPTKFRTFIYLLTLGNSYYFHVF